VNYISHSEADIARMLQTIGVGSLDELIAKVIPERFRFKDALDLSSGMSEYELIEDFKGLASENLPAAEHLCFLGGGVYDHYIPAAISHLLSRSEFYTAYTPYQAEVAQGTLQTIYEYQSMVCRLMAMDAANASHYDGATALAESAIMAARKTGRKSIVVPYGLNPNYLRVLKTYCEPVDVEIRRLSLHNGVIDVDELRSSIDGAAGLIVQHPNYFGLLEPVEAVSQIAHAAGALVVSSTYPISLALLKPPGEWGADIATADGQSLGVPMSFGGPYVGLFAAKKELVRMMPGRIVARAKDRLGRDGYVLTLQTREQHIRREKATSNICTNQALIALNALIYLSLVGKDGLQKAALNSYRAAHYLANRVNGLEGVKLRFRGEFFNEFTLELPIDAETAQQKFLNEAIFVGPFLGQDFPGMENCLLIAVTEKRNKDELDRFVEAVQEVL